MQYFLIYLSFLIFAIGIVILFMSIIFNSRLTVKAAIILRIVGMAIMFSSLFCYSAGDNFRKSMMKDQVVKYYNEGISYKELNEKQMKNIGAIFSIKDIPEEDREQYFDAFKFYIVGYYESLGYDERFIKDSLYEFLYKYMP